MKPKQIVLGCIIVVGLGISAYLWSTTDIGAAQGDNRVMDKMMTYTCPQCQAEFSMTVEKAGEQRRANDGNLICPHCQATGAVKTVSISGPSIEEDAADDEPASDEELRPVKAIGRAKKEN